MACPCRLLVVIAAPLLFIVSLVGVVIWLVLLPLKICCCPVGCALQLVYNTIEYVVKAPMRAMLWASGKPWKPRPPPESNGHKDGAGKV